MFDELTREGDPEFRYQPANESQRICIEIDSASVIEFLRQADADMEIPTSIERGIVAEPRHKRVIGFRQKKSKWLQFNLAPDFTDPLVLNLVEYASESLCTRVYETSSSVSGFSYSLQESGEVIEQYSRFSEPVYEYIPEEERKSGTLVTEDGFEFIWTRRETHFDRKFGLQPGHEKTMLETLRLDVITAPWPVLDQGNVVTPTGYDLNQFLEFLVL